jgi:hypothetical protein
MAITVKKTFLWKKELDNHPGAMAEALETLAEGDADLQLVMVYRFPDAHKGAIEVHPILGRKLISAAKSAGFAQSHIPVLLVEGDDRQGLGYALAKAIGDAGISVSFLMAQVVGRRYAAIFGFKNDDDAAKAVTLIKKAATQSRGR